MFHAYCVCRLRFVPALTTTHTSSPPPPYNARHQADNITSIVSASGNSIAAYWGSLVSKALEGKDLDDIIMKPGAGGGPVAGAGAGAGAAEAVAEEKAEESEEESAGGAGGLFDDDDDDW